MAIVALWPSIAPGQTLHENATQSLLDAANGQPICDQRAEPLAHCVPGPISRILAGENWRLILNFTPSGIEVACLGGDPDACRLSQLAQDALSKRAAVQKCVGKRDCKAAQKEANRSEMASTMANNAAIIRPDGCCGTALQAMDPTLTKGAQVALAVVAASAAIYVVRACQQVRRKPVILLNANDVELLKACEARGF